MPHSYKNYVHLEGVVDLDAAVSSTPEGDVVSFTIAVRDTTRDADGATIKRTDLFHVEVGPKTTRFAASLKKGTTVMIDGTLKLQSLLVGDEEYSGMTIRAHRVHSVDYNGWRKAESELLSAGNADVP